MLERARLWGSAFVVAAVVAGCGLSETVVTTGIVAQNQANQLKSLQNVQKYANKSAAENQMRRAIGLFDAENGRPPTSIKEMLDSGHLGQVPQLKPGLVYDYNPFTGQIAVREGRPGEPQVPGIEPLQPGPPVPPGQPVYQQPGQQVPNYFQQETQGYGAAQPGQHYRQAPVVPQQRAVPQRRPAQRVGTGFGGSPMMQEIGITQQFHQDFDNRAASGAYNASVGMKRQAGRAIGNYQQRQNQAVQQYTR